MNFSNLRDSSRTHLYINSNKTIVSNLKMSNNKIWATFEGKKIVNGTKRKYWIQTATEEFYDDIVKHMSSGFLLDEPICRYTGKFLKVIYELI